MASISDRPAMDDGERTLRRIARGGAVLALAWAAGGAWLAGAVDAHGVLGWVIAVVAIAPLYLLYAVAGEVLGGGAVRRWSRAFRRAFRIRLPPNVTAALNRHVGGAWLLLLAVPAAIALAWLFVE